MKRTELVNKWIDALRSGKYEQGQSYLYKDGKYCCLGVGLLIASGVPCGYDSLTSKLGTTSSERYDLIKMNDHEGKTFPEIADAIEAMIDE